MSKELVLIGDISSHGGSMVSANANFKTNGKKVCVNNDLHSCPIPGHGITSVTANGSFKSIGSKVIVTGDSASCGAVLTGTSSVKNN